jgi:hypothetical protein
MKYENNHHQIKSSSAAGGKRGFLGKGKSKKSEGIKSVLNVWWNFVSHKNLDLEISFVKLVTSQ